MSSPTDNLSYERVQTLLAFIQIAELLNRGLSHKEIAHHVKRSPGFVTKLIKQIEMDFAERPLIRRSGQGEKTELTEDGQCLLKDTLYTLKSIEPRESKLVVASSTSLVTNHAFGPAIRAFLSDGTSNRLNFKLLLQTKIDPDELREHVATGEIDLAFVFGNRERRMRHPELEIHALASRFDLVCISHEEELIHSINLDTHVNARDLSRRRAAFERLLTGRRVARLSERVQPLVQLLKPAIHGIEGVTEVDSYDAVMRMVGARVADVGIVPAFYPELLRSFMAGELYYSQPIGSVEVISISKKGMSKVNGADHLRNLFDEQLREVTERPASKFKWTMLPKQRKLADFGKLKFGYYIDGRRTRHGSSLSSTCSPPYEWRSEQISWTLEEDSRLIGEAHNCEGDSFDLVARLAGAAFIIEANGRKDNPRSIQQFVSVFSKLTRTQGIQLLGVWSSFELHSEGLFTTILSETELDINQLKEMQKQSLRFVFSAGKGAPEFGRSFEKT